MLRNVEDCMRNEGMCHTHLSAMELWSKEYGCPIDVTTSILEVGSGNGFFLEFLRKKGYQKYSGIDPNPRHGRKRLNIKKGFIENISPSNEKFDCIRTSSVFHELFYGDNRLRILKKIHELLKPNGVYFGFEPIESDEVIETIQNIHPRANSIIFGRNGHVHIPAKK